MKRRTDPAWRDTPEADAKYRNARAEAQTKANETGIDYGLEANDFFQTFRVFMLPKKQNRRGFELRCEVVMCENLSKCQPGHGPGR
jgi:hypothetical protein